MPFGGFAIKVDYIAAAIDSYTTSCFGFSTGGFGEAKEFKNVHETVRCETTTPNFDSNEPTFPSIGMAFRNEGFVPRGFNALGN